MALPDRLVTDFNGAQRNFEALDVLVRGLSSSISLDESTISALQSSVSTLQSNVSTLQSNLAALTTTVGTKVASVVGADGVTHTGTTSVTITIDSAKTSGNVVPSASNRLQLSGYRSITAGSAGTSASGSPGPLLASDYFVEVASSASTVANVYLPSATATDQFAGKMYIIRNGRTVNINVQGVSRTATGNYITIANGTVLIVINTGTKWRSLLGVATLNTVGGIN